MTLPRRTNHKLWLACAVLTFAFRAAADEPAVPLQLQVDLTVKVIEYAQQPAIRSADIVRVGVLVKASSAQSMRFGAELKAALDRIDTIAGLAHEQSTIAWASAASFVEEARKRRLSVVYLAPGLDAEVSSIAEALQGIQIITVAATDSYVQSGAILGFELVSGHPKMVFNLAQAKQQDVVFGSAVMKLMRIVE
jgi:hypothetical protein